MEYEFLEKTRNPGTDRRDISTVYFLDKFIFRPMVFSPLCGLTGGGKVTPLERPLVKMK